MRRLSLALAVAVLFLAGPLVAYAIMGDVTWPYDEDHLRDIGSAQAFLDGNFAGDPTYAGERRWYPPIVPMLLAATHALTGLALPRAHVLLGLVLGLLPVASLTALTWAWFGRLAGLWAAAAAVVLAQGTVGGWISARYTPWLFSAALAIVPTAGALYAMSRTTRTWWVLAGAAAGVTALADVGAAVMLGMVAIALGWRQPARLIWAGVPAVVVAGWHFAPLLIAYGGHVLNPLPSAWRYSYGSIETLAPNLTLGLGLAGIGLWHVARDPRARVLLAWIAAAAVLFVEGYFGTRLGWPQLVPDWHFWVHLHAAEVVLAGVGGAWLTDQLPIRWQQEPRIAVLVLALCLVHAPRYLQQFDLTVAVDRARARSSSDHASLVAAVRALVPADAIVLTTHDLAQRVLVPAAHAALCVDPYFSSPFVDWASRHAQHVEALRAGHGYGLSTDVPAGARVLYRAGALVLWQHP